MASIAINGSGHPGSKRSPFITVRAAACRIVIFNVSESHRYLQRGGPSAASLYLVVSPIVMMPAASV